MIKQHDFRIVHKEGSELQKLLNQWRHLYELKIIFITYDNLTLSFIAVIERTPKTN